MSSYTQQQIDKANSVSLPEFLMSQGEQLEKSGQEYRWGKHDSMTMRENKWFRHSRSKGGYPIDFVMEFMGKTFPEAVKMLTGEDPPSGSETTDDRFRLPKRNTNNDGVMKYLIEDRCLDKKIVEAFFMSGAIYEDEEHHNVVFVGRDRNGIPRYASYRGTHDKFRQDVFGSDKSYGFSHEGSDRRLFVFEAPIDLMSFICLYPKDWKSRNYCSLGGVSGKTMLRILSERKDIDQMFLCLDNDTAGNEASSRLLSEMLESVNKGQCWSE